MAEISGSKLTFSPTAYIELHKLIDPPGKHIFLALNGCR